MLKGATLKLMQKAEYYSHSKQILKYKYQFYLLPHVVLRVATHEYCIERILF